MIEFETLVLMQFKNINEQLAEFRAEMNAKFAEFDTQFAINNVRLDRLEAYVSRLEDNQADIYEEKTTVKYMLKVIEMLTELQDGYYVHKRIFVKQG